MLKGDSMAKGFNYNGEWFTPYRKLTKAEREQPLRGIEDKLLRYSNEEFEAYWDMMEFFRVSKSDANLFWWKGKVIMPSLDTFYIINGSI